MLDLSEVKYDSSRVKILDHPLAQSILTELRDKSTGQIEFRKGLVRLGRLMAFRIVEDFDTETVYVETPLNVKARGIRIPDLDKIIIIQILRAAMPFVEGMLKIFPAAKMGVISARRVEEKGMKPNKTFDVEVKYVKLPRIEEDNIAIIADPMFATGSTALKALDIVKNHGTPKKLIVATVISTPLAIKRVLDYDEKLMVYTVAIDNELNEKGYIVPGLGDAGDRAFGE